MLALLAEADVVACEDTRHTRKLLDRHGIEPRGQVLATTSTTSASGPRSWWSGSAAARSGAGERRRDAGGLRSRARCSCARASTRACRSRCLPGPSALVTALVAVRPAAERWCFAGFLPRKKGELERELRERAGRWSPSSRRARLGTTLALLAEIDPERPVAVCRELTKVHEEVVRGTAARAGRAVRRGHAGRGRARDRARDRSAEDDRGAARRRSSAWSRRARGGARRRRWCSRLTGVPANRLYRPANKEYTMAESLLDNYRQQSYDTWEQMAAGLGARSRSSVADVRIRSASGWSRRRPEARRHGPGARRRHRRDGFAAAARSATRDG